MTIINNHNIITLEKDDKNEFLLSHFNKHNVDIEISLDFEILVNHLTSLSKEDYPFDFDPAFTPDTAHAVVSGSRHGAILLLKSGDNIVGTYAFKKALITNLIEQIPIYKESAECVKPETLKAFWDGESLLDNQYYSSCQWIHPDFLGKRLGMALDHLKKYLIFDVLDGNINWAMFTTGLEDYHTGKLTYQDSAPLFTTPDKEYKVTWSTKEYWHSRFDYVKALYS
jgi:hypothetical protein